MLTGVSDEVDESPAAEPSRENAARWWRRPGVRRWRRRLVRLAVAGVLLVVVTVGASVVWVRSGAAGHIFSEVDVPPAPVALVLGAQVNPDGQASPFLAARLDLARRLFLAGKVRVILVSGDNMRLHYDEPDAMRGWLIAHDVPAAKIVRDYAGFDTYDSCDRAIRIFGVHQAIVVTQSYHVPRAVMLCRRLGLDASGVGDESVKQYRWPWLISSTREYGACVKAVFDVVSGRDPVYLGRHETGVEDALRAS